MSLPGMGRRAILTTAATAGLAGVGVMAAGSAHAAPDPEPTARPPIILVHGALNDASAWREVVARLQAWGFDARAVHIPLAGLRGDVDAVRRAVDAAPRPVILVGHSYSGAVICGASGLSRNVAALVYCAAAVLDEGETLDQVNAPYPPAEDTSIFSTDSAGYVTASPEGFVRIFAHDVEPREAWVRAVSQKPVFSGTGSQASGPVGWHRLPCYYQISALDKVMSPGQQRDVAARLRATTITVRSSHLSPVSHPGEIAGLIRHAAREHS